MTLLLAGHETTAMALTWALAAIDQAPDVRAELETEWDARREGRPADQPVTLPSATLPLTTAVLAETLRLWPPSWLFSRRVLEPLALGGRTISAGTMCLISPALLHRDLRWWVEPDQVLAAPLAAPRNRTARPLRSQGARPAARRLPAIRRRPQDVYRRAVRLGGGRDDAGRARPDLARPSDYLHR
jgi:hypothetical protein